MSKKFFGVIPPIVTPIDVNEKVDEKSLRKLVNYTIEVGMHGIFVAGSTGECLGLTQKERNRAIKITLDECGDRLPVLAGVMDSSTKRVIENIKEFEQMGGKTAVVTPVFYAKNVSPYEAIHHFEEISKHTNVEIVIYNIPVFTGCTLKASTIFELAKIDKVVGYKDSANIMQETVKCIEHFRGTDFAVLQGITQLGGITTLIGGDGTVPSIAPVFPKACLKAYDYGKKQNVEKALFWNEVLRRCQDICATIGINSISTTKYAVSTLGITSELMTSPYEMLKNDEKKLVRERIKEMRDFIDKQEN